MLSAILSLAAPAILGPAGLSLVANPMVASAIGGGLGSLLQGGDTKDVLTGAALGGIGSALGGAMGGSSALELILLIYLQQQVGKPCPQL